MLNLILEASRRVAESAAARLALVALVWCGRQIKRRRAVAKEPEYLSVGQVAAKLGLRSPQIIRLFERGLLPPAKRAGLFRIIPTADLPKVKEAAQTAGYIA